MATKQLATVLEHIRTLTAGPKGSEQTDGNLLRAFLKHYDQAAFETLVRRHGPMVLRVCRRTLGNVHDAEDALQATFLVLARQAASVRKRESLGSWLHGVAYRMAANVRRAAARRHKHEARANPNQTKDPSLSVAMKELQVILDEEIEALNETLRAPFVLCCLENQSSAEAAQQLGLEEATVRKRLSRARKLLQDRLMRRGVALTAVLAAAALGANNASAELPRYLVAATVRTATVSVAGQATTAGLVCARVAALAEGMLRSLFLDKLKTGTVIVLVVTLAGMGTGALGYRSLLAPQRADGTASSTSPVPPDGTAAKIAMLIEQLGSDTADDREKAAKELEAVGGPALDALRKAAGDGQGERKKLAQDLVQKIQRRVREVRGRVLGPDDRPCAGAKLYLGFSNPKEPTYPVRATSGGDGRFAFTFARSELDMAYSDNPVYQVLAVAEGHGCSWATGDAAAGELTLRLVPDAPVGGRILDADGRPVAGARLAVTGVGDDADFVEWVRIGYRSTRTNAGGDIYQFAKGCWIGPLPGLPAVLVTDNSGRFKLSGVGRGRVVSFHLEGAGIATAALGVRGTSFEYQAAASRPIRGVVRDKATGKSLPAVTVFFDTWLDPRNEEPVLHKAVTDKQGRYELLGLPKAEDYALALRPADGLYFQRKVRVQDTPGLGALTADFELEQGEVTVRGKVTEKETGRPVAGATVDSNPLTGTGGRAETTTGPDGAYILKVGRGSHTIGVAGPNPDAYMPAFLPRADPKAPVPDFRIAPETYHALVLIAPEKEEVLVKDVALELPQQRKGRVLGPDGQPLSGTTITGLAPRWNVVETVKGAEFIVRGINPQAPPRSLTFLHRDKKLGLFLKELPEETSGPLTVNLQPCGVASGRLIDQDGQPRAELRAYLAAPPHVVGRQEVTTDKDGVFRAEGLVPGVTYRVMRPQSRYVLAEVVVEPGKTKDLGNIKPAPDEN
jgi:RNA polymerase sigma factor (sigma-70 family)